MRARRPRPALDLLVELGVLDRGAGAAREHLGDEHVAFAEPSARLGGDQRDRARRLAPAADGDAEVRARRERAQQSQVHVVDRERRDGFLGRLLDDDKHMLAADNVLPVVTIALRDTDGFVAAVNEIAATLDTDTLIGLNKRFDVDKEDAEVIAKDFLTDQGLI